MGRDLLWKLAHAILEAEKSLDLLSASWRPRKASGVSSSPSPKTSPESKGASGINLSSRAEGRQTGSKKGANSPFLHLFVLFKPSADWMMPTHSEEEGKPLY